MKRMIGPLTVLAMTCIWPAMSGTAIAQWYANPQMTVGGNSDANSMLLGNGYMPGSGILPGGGVPPAPAPATGETEPSGDSGASGGGGYSFTSDPASSYETAVYSGMSNLIRSEGSYNRQTARGMIDYEKARSLYVDNQLRVYSARRSIARSKLAAQAEDIEYQQAMAARSNAFAAAHRPQPLGAERLDYSSGAIHWPAVFESPDFAELRKQIDSDFGAKVNGKFDPEKAIEIKKHVHDLKDLLHEEILKIPLENYSLARQFLDQLSVSVE